MMKKGRHPISRANELKMRRVDGVAVDDAGRAGDVGEGGAYRRNDKRDGKGA